MKRTPACIATVVFPLPHRYNSTSVRRRKGSNPGKKGADVFAASLAAQPRSYLDSSVLMLNAHYMAMRVVSVRRAFTLLFKHDVQNQPVAEIVSAEDGRYVSYDFADWAELSQFRKEFEPDGHDWIRTVRFDIVVPRIIRVLTFAKLPRQEVKFNRRNLFARDHNTCQYCGKRYTTSQLSLDHVIPRSQGGKTMWENIVCACLKCNVRKGGRT
ncbi:MAG: HNH endonuclease, partial [Phycisphaerales bacterium]|nr:HNH endonuclease [Phycisphaerales bacterium]